jgi:hypothetical protein
MRILHPTKAKDTDMKKDARTSNAALVESPKLAFEPNAFYEKILDLRRTNPAAFASLAPVTRLALGAYEAQKRENERLQAIRDEPAAA